MPKLRRRWGQFPLRRAQG